jgi:hypothetical protein
MTIINVSINGNKLFKWEGSAEDAGKLDEAVKELARNNGMTPEQLGDSAAVYVLKSGDFVTQSRGEMPILVWMLLSKPTGNPDHPGIFRDYIEVWDFDFDICEGSDAKRIRVGVAARMQGGEQWESLN